MVMDFQPVYDCNDFSASLNAADVDGDGYSTCDNDCDDDDAVKTPADNDGDGFTTCGDPLVAPIRL